VFKKSKVVHNVRYDSFCYLCIFVTVHSCCFVNYTEHHTITFILLSWGYTTGAFGDMKWFFGVHFRQHYDILFKTPWAAFAGHSVGQLLYLAVEEGNLYRNIWLRPDCTVGGSLIWMLARRLAR
jgi:hypothetical protein